MSTKDHLDYRKKFVDSEVNEIASFKPIKKDDDALNVHDAARQIEIDDYENDALARARKNIEISQGIKEGKLDPKVYRGESGYANYFE